MSDMTDVTKEKLIADVKLVIADTEELLRATAGQAGEKIADIRAAPLAVLAEILLRDFLERQEAVAGGAIVDETRFERGFYAGDSTLVDVGFFLFAGGELYAEIVKFLTINQSDSQLFFLSCIDEHSFHVPLLGNSRGSASGRREVAQF